KAIIATMLLFYAVSHWNSWFQAFLYLSDKELFPVTMYLRNMIAGTSQTSDVAAASAAAQTQISSNIKAVTMVLTVLPILCVYPRTQHYFPSVTLLGSVKHYPLPCSPVPTSSMMKGHLMCTRRKFLAAGSAALCLNLALDACSSGDVEEPVYDS